MRCKQSRAPWSSDASWSARRMWLNASISRTAQPSPICSPSRRATSASSSSMFPEAAANSCAVLDSRRSRSALRSRGLVGQRARVRQLRALRDVDHGRDRHQRPRSGPDGARRREHGQRRPILSQQVQLVGMVPARAKRSPHLGHQRLARRRDQLRAIGADQRADVVAHHAGVRGSSAELSSVRSRRTPTRRRS